MTSPNTGSGSLMPIHPELAKKIQQGYIEAGAELIITDTPNTGREM